MAINRGYLKVPRALFATNSWRAKRTFSRFEAMLWLLEQAAYTDGRRVAIGRTTFALQRGQVVATVRSLAEAWGWSKDAVSRFLAQLASCDMSYTQLQIAVENIDYNGATVCATAGATPSATAATRITICDYDAYALASSDDATASATPPATASATPLYKYENKEEKNSEEIKEKKGNECSRACVGDASAAPTSVTAAQEQVKPQEKATEKATEKPHEKEGRTDPTAKAVKNNNLDYNSANNTSAAPTVAAPKAEKPTTAAPATDKTAAATPKAVAPAAAKPANFTPTVLTSSVPMPVIKEPKTLPEYLVVWAQYNYPQIAGMRYPLTLEDAEYMLKLYTTADIKYLFGRMQSKEVWLNNTYFLSTFLAYARHDKSVKEIQPPKPKISPNPKHRC